MAQSYFPTARTSSPSSLVDDEEHSLRSALAGMSAGKHLKVEDVQEAYIEQKDCLLTAIDSTKGILSDLRDFNNKEWVVRYPQLRPIPSPDSDVPTPSPKPSSRQRPRRSMTFADDPSNETEVIVSKQGLSRSITLAAISDATDSDQPKIDVSPSLDTVQEDPHSTTSTDPLLLPPSDFHVLRLDLKLGAHGSTTSASSLVSHLEKSSIANLLDARLAAATNHLSNLRSRLEDTSSKVLVTGDLNAGKSTFVNALLRREVLPIDQQPCTAAFCEVRDARENDGVEEVHVCKEGLAYDIKDEKSFERRPLDDLETLASEGEALLKIYLADTRAPTESLLNNGVVDIALIDAPGLNRDSLKTTALFARQEEIDVVVFVVSAENHFTLSAKEFLFSASREKAYLFIVVNKFEGIRNKEKCKRLVLEQIRALSPRTWEDAEDLVHFVDSAGALSPTGAASPSFDDLETALRSFVLVKRSKSKMQPVRTYLDNLLGDVEVLSGANIIVAEGEYEQARSELERVRPVLKKMMDGRGEMDEVLEGVEEEGVKTACLRAEALLKGALERIAQGKLAVDRGVQMPSYPGLLGVWEYARAVRRAMLASLDLTVGMAEDSARDVTSEGVRKVSEVGERYLPEGVERSRRVFMPEAMFRVGKNGLKSKGQGRKRGSVVVVGGVHGLGLGLAQREDLLETTFEDLFDLHHQFHMHFRDGKKERKINDSEEEGSLVPVSALSLLGVGIGTLGMVGGQLGAQAIGVRGVIEGVVRVVEVIKDENLRKWAAPIVGAVALGAMGYVVMELPRTIPKTVGRRVRNAVVHDHVHQQHRLQRKHFTSTSSSLQYPAFEDENENVFVNVHSERIAKETRKVLRLASWDVKERFREAMEERVKEVKGAEEVEKRAGKAKEMFKEVGERCAGVRENINLGVGA